MTFLSLNILAFWLLCLYFLFKNSRKLKAKHVELFKKKKQEFGIDEFKEFMHHVLLAGFIVTGVLCLWEIAVLMHLATHKYYPLLSVIMIVLTIILLFISFNQDPKVIIKYSETEPLGNKIPVPKWRIILSKGIILFSLLFYTAVFIRLVFKYDIISRLF